MTTTWMTLTALAVLAVACLAALAWALLHRSRRHSYRLRHLGDERWRYDTPHGPVDIEPVYLDDGRGWSFRLRYRLYDEPEREDFVAPHVPVAMRTIHHEIDAFAGRQGVASGNHTRGESSRR